SARICRTAIPTRTANTTVACPEPLFLKKNQNRVVPTPSPVLEGVQCMSIKHLSLAKIMRSVLFSFLLLVAPYIVCGQNGSSATQANSSDEKRTASAEYEIGPGDIVAITIVEAPELSGKFRITEAGDLVLGELGSPLKASGQTARQLAQNIKQALI